MKPQKQADKKATSYIMRRRKGWSNIMIAIYAEIAFQITCELNDDNYNMYDRKKFYDYMSDYYNRGNWFYHHVEIYVDFDAKYDKLVLDYFAPRPDSERDGKTLASMRLDLDYVRNEEFLHEEQLPFSGRVWWEHR